MTGALEQVLANHRGEAAVLRHQGHKLQAESIERVCEDVAGAMEAYLDWLTEDEAKSRSGRPVDWLRNRFPGWSDLGLARMTDGRPGRRMYRRIVIPIRANLDAARADARRTAEKLS